MSKKIDISGILLAGISGAYTLVLMLIRAFSPSIILPEFDFMTILILALTSLVLDYYLSKSCQKNYLLSALYSFLIFGLFPWLSCFLPLLTALKTAVMGAITFTVSAIVFDSIVNRLSTDKINKVAPLISALGLYLAAQCLIGIF